MKILIYLFNIFAVVSSREFTNKLDRYLIACHTTDFECFKRQYATLRDNCLLGNHQLAIDFYEAYMFRYGDTGTCVRITGVEDSELNAISINSNTMEYSIVLELPIKIQQIRNPGSCDKPDKPFPDTGRHIGALKKFSGNATVSVTYPYSLLKKKGRVHMILDDENLDVVLDIPDLSQYDRDSELESKLYEWSEWAYEMVQHVDIAQDCFVSYTGQLRRLMERIPLEKFLLLYPDEEYTDLQVSYNMNKNSE